MGYASDLGTGTVHSLCPVTGYPRTQYRHLLDTADPHDGRPVLGWEKSGTELPNFTSPYGHLFYAIGSGDDFWCFDFADVNAGPRGRFIILHATINSETGGFIEDAPHGYKVMPANSMAEQAAVVREAFGMADQAVEWCMHNDIRHGTKGWNQNDRFFPLSVAQHLSPWRFKRRDGTQLSLRKNNRAALKIAHSLAFCAARAIGGQ